MLHGPLLSGILPPASLTSKLGFFAFIFYFNYALDAEDSEDV